MDRLPTPPSEVPSNSSENLPPNPPPKNPFTTFQSRYWVLGAFLVVSVAVGALYSLLELFSLLPSRQEDAIATPIMTIAVWTLLATAIGWEGTKQGLRAQPLFGKFWRFWRLGKVKQSKEPLLGHSNGRNQPQSRLSLLYAGLLVMSLLIFSLGSFSIIFYGLSLFFPDYAAQVLDSNLMPGSGGSRYPELYDALMIFLLIVYAPLVEELVFRGILLQRWSVKWGLPWGIAASSALFGLLHFNNPLGLMLFGLVMGLLYVRTQSLWVSIICHGLNNLGAVGIDQLSKATGGSQSYTLADVQASWWQGLVLIAVSMPLLARFVWKSWPRSGYQIPYLLNSRLIDGELAGELASGDPVDLSDSSDRVN